MVTKMMKLEMPTLQEMLQDSGGNEDLLEELLCKFRLWLTQQIHLPQDISDQRLKFFICTVKFDFEKAKKNLDTLYTLHTLLPEMYDDLDPLSEEVKLSCTVFQIIPLPMLTPNKYRVHMLRLKDYDASKYNIRIVTRYCAMIIEMLIEEDIVTNTVFIIDCVGVNINHVMQYTPMMLKKIDSCLKAYGLRVKEIYVINAPQSVDLVMKAAKSVMRAKLFSRIQIHTSGIESLYDVIPRSILPTDYGGDQPSINALSDMWQTKLVERRDWFLEEEKRKANESVRKSNSIINPDNVFGMPGTFRQLQID